MRSLSKIYTKMLELAPEKVYRVLKAWNKDKDLWKRRQSVVTLLYYSRTKKVYLAFDAIEPLITGLLSDKEYYVQKGGWLGIEGDAQCVSEGDEGVSGEEYQKGEQYRVYDCDGEDGGGGEEQVQSTSETENFMMKKSKLESRRLGNIWLSASE